MSDIALTMIQVVVLGVTIGAIGVGNLIQAGQNKTIAATSSDSGVGKFTKYLLLTIVSFGYVLLLSLAAITKDIHSPITVLIILIMGITTGFAGILAGSIPQILSELDILAEAVDTGFFNSNTILITSTVILWSAGVISSFFNFNLVYISGTQDYNVLYVLSTISFIVVNINITRVDRYYAS